MVPSRQLGLHFLDQELHLAVQYWLGLPIFSVDFPIFNLFIPLRHHHQVGCRGNWDLIRRHDSLRDILYSAAQSVALAPHKEMPSLIPGSCSRPADIFLPQWEGGCATAPGCHGNLISSEADSV